MAPAFRQYVIAGASLGNARSISKEVSGVQAVKFSKEEKAIIVQKVQMYFREELDQDIGQFDAEFLLDFFSEEVGSYYYNRGLYDAQAVLKNKMDDIAEAIYDIEKTTDFHR